MITRSLSQSPHGYIHFFPEVFNAPNYILLVAISPTTATVSCCCHCCGRHHTTQRCTWHTELVATRYLSLLPPDAAENTVLLTAMICLNRKYKRAASTSKLILTLDDIVFIDTQVSKKVCPLGQQHNISYHEQTGFAERGQICSCSDCEFEVGPDSVWADVWANHQTHSGCKVSSTSFWSDSLCPEVDWNTSVFQFSAFNSVTV